MVVECLLSGSRVCLQRDVHICKEMSPFAKRCRLSSLALCADADHPGGERNLSPAGGGKGGMRRVTESI